MKKLLEGGKKQLEMHISCSSPLAADIYQGIYPKGKDPYTCIPKDPTSPCSPIVSVVDGHPKRHTVRRALSCTSWEEAAKNAVERAKAMASKEKQYCDGEGCSPLAAYVFDSDWAKWFYGEC